MKTDRFTNRFGYHTTENLGPKVSRPGIVREYDSPFQPFLGQTTVKPPITDSPSNGQPPYNGLMSWHRLLLPYVE